jgi:hypothetical protein
MNPKTQAFVIIVSTLYTFFSLCANLNQMKNIPLIAQIFCSNVGVSAAVALDSKPKESEEGKINN